MSGDSNVRRCCMLLNPAVCPCWKGYLDCGAAGVAAAGGGAHPGVEAAAAAADVREALVGAGVHGCS